MAAANVLDIAAEIDPSKIISKIKYHLLAHLRQDIVRFGPLVGVATENFESYNAIFRFCSILSNHLAPSRDIAYQLSKQETFKHILSGGWWWSAKTAAWEQAGAEIQRFIGHQPVIRKLLGWTESDASVGVKAGKTNQRNLQCLSLSTELKPHRFNHPSIYRSQNVGKSQT